MGSFTVRVLLLILLLGLGLASLPMTVRPAPGPSKPAAAMALPVAATPSGFTGTPAPHEGETRLRLALARLEAEARAGGWPPIAGGPALSEGSGGPRVRKIRRRLGLPDAGDRFDGELTAAVKRFQRRHGLEADGVVGDRTLAELNVPIARRIARVEANLRRWGNVPSDPGDPHVLVNIPEFALALVRGGEPVWRTRIVAGRAWTPTPVLSDRIVAVVANPGWNVPARIAVKEYLPDLRRDPQAAGRLRLRLFQPSRDGAGREIDPSSIDWERVDEENFPWLMRLDPGPANPLGRVKFVLTNTMAIYLHDTPEKHLFSQVERDFSHGCIRVENPSDLAVALLDDPAALHEALADRGERRLPVRPPVPIHILYMTAWVDEQGDLHFRQDVYGLDPPD